ncbi:MAG TPA: hypothetical protein VL334_23900 [Anaerolineae bacterium]|nr:hypothetical protein [Anaerolineae bacterium]
MKTINQLVVPGVLVLALLLAGCQTPPPGPTPAPGETATVEASPTEAPPTPTLGPTPLPTAEPVTEADLDASLDVARDFLARLATGDYRVAYGTLLTTGGQQRLADLVLGRLALSNPHISFFELLGSQPADGRIAVDVVWRETFEGQGELGTQEATVFLARQDNRILVDDVELGSYVPAATPVPQALPRAQTLSSPAVAGQELRFQASGFQAGETVLAWLELADGTLLEPLFGTADSQGVLDVAYEAAETSGQPAGRWIWWAQALRDSTRNTGITFEVQAGPTAVPTQPPVAVAPTQPPARPAATPAATTPPVAAPPTPTATSQPPSTAYGAPTLLWPEPVTSREFGSALIVEFVPVADVLAADEWYELVLVASTQLGTVYNAGSVRGKGDTCDGVYSTACVKLIANEQFMRGFHPDGVDGNGEWYVQVVRQTGADQYTTVSPASESRTVVLKPRS